MEANVETSVLPVSASPAWAIRVARRTGDGFRMAEHLRGVPKLMLQTVFGCGLGRRIWELARRNGAQPGVGAVSRVSDGDLSIGMVEYLSQQAADTLRDRRRKARAIRLTITYADGESRTTRMRLAQPTSEGNEIAMASRALLRRFPACQVRTIDLVITSIAATSVPEKTSAHAKSLASA
jgi:hypothetical protein